jgi:hypothetical protein
MTVKGVVMNIHAIDFNISRRVPERLVYLGNHARPYGVNEPDTWAMDHYFAAAIANGLRMLVAYGNAVRDVEEYERIASYLEFYASCPSDALFEHIDFSQDKDEDNDEADLLEWVNADDRSAWPGMNEYCDKSAQIDEIRFEYQRRAFEWLTQHWGELWD